MFSVIVPIYKVEKYLTQCIESILNQSYKDFELILVDDGSPDGCPQICDKYAKKDTRIKVVHKTNGGSVSARKAGVDIAQGEYICFVDGDDFISSGLLDSYEQVLGRKKCDIICTGYCEYYSEKRIVPIHSRIPTGFYDKNDLISKIYPQMLSIKPFYTFYVSPTVWSKCFRRSIAVESSKKIPDNISIGDDVAVVYNALLMSSSISFIDECGYMYRQNFVSMTHTYDSCLFEKIKTLILYLKNVEKQQKWDFENQINEYTTFLLFYAKNNEFSFNNGDSYKAKKKNMNRYLCDSTFKEALRKVKLSGIRNKFILFCFRIRWILPLYLWDKIKSIGSKK